MTEWMRGYKAALDDLETDLVQFAYTSYLFTRLQGRKKTVTKILKDMGAEHGR